MKKKIIINAGHSLSDSGAVSGDKTESVFARKLRDKLVPLLKEVGIEVIEVPDDYNLQESINFVNKYSKNLDDALALSIHLNAGGGTGAEVFYHPDSKISKAMAMSLVNVYCYESKYKNRGAKPDTSSARGRLAWIRDTNPYALLVEACFLDSEEDMKKMNNDMDSVADALYVAILGLYGMKKPDKDEENNKLKKEIKETYTYLGTLIDKL